MMMMMMMMVMVMVMMMIVGRVSCMDPTNQLMSIHIFIHKFHCTYFPRISLPCLQLQDAANAVGNAASMAQSLLHPQGLALVDIFDCLSPALLRASGGASNSECNHGCIMILGTQCVVNDTWKELARILIL